MTLDQINDLKERADALALSVVEYAGAELCEDTNRIESHIFRHITTSANYLEALQLAGERAQDAHETCNVLQLRRA